MNVTKLLLANKWFNLQFKFLQQKLCLGLGILKNINKYALIISAFRLIFLPKLFHNIYCSKNLRRHVLAMHNPSEAREETVKMGKPLAQFFTQKWQLKVCLHETALI
jgi:urease accessory protein UreF